MKTLQELETEKIRYQKIQSLLNSYTMYITPAEKILEERKRIKIDLTLNYLIIVISFCIGIFYEALNRNGNFKSLHLWFSTNLKYDFLNLLIHICSFFLLIVILKKTIENGKLKSRAIDKKKEFDDAMNDIDEKLFKNISI